MYDNLTVLKIYGKNIHCDGYVNDNFKNFNILSLKTIHSVN